MAWVRISMAMISFGFTMVKFVEYLEHDRNLRLSGPLGHSYGAEGLGFARGGRQDGRGPGRGGAHGIRGHLRGLRRHRLQAEHGRHLPEEHRQRVGDYPAAVAGERGRGRASAERADVVLRWWRRPPRCPVSPGRTRREVSHTLPRKTWRPRSGRCGFGTREDGMWRSSPPVSHQRIGEGRDRRALGEHEKPTHRKREAAQPRGTPARRIEG